jgi:ABC-type Fe3+ transport system permease subunit
VARCAVVLADRRPSDRNGGGGAADVLKTPLYGSIAILVVGHVAVYVAFGTRSMISALIQIDKELENAAIVSGASWATSLRRVSAPLIWRTSSTAGSGWLRTAHAT